MCLQKKGLLFLKNLYKSWESLVTLQLQSDCFVVFWANESEKQDITTFCTILPNKEEVPFMELSRDNDRKRKESPYMEMWPDNDKKNAYISTEMQLQNHSLTLIHENKSLLSATRILFCSPMAHNTTASLDKLTCTDFVDFG